MRGSGWAKEAQSHAESNPEAGGVSCFGSGPRAPPEAEAAAYTGRDHMPHSCRLFVGGWDRVRMSCVLLADSHEEVEAGLVHFGARCVLQRGPTRRWLRALGVRLVQVAYINLRVSFVQALGQWPLIDGGEFRGVITNSPEMPCQARSTLLAQQVKRPFKGSSLIGGKSVRFQEHVGSRRKPANKCRTRPGT